MKVTIRQYQQEVPDHFAKVIFMTEESAKEAGTDLQKIIQANGFSGKTAEAETFVISSESGMLKYIVSGIGKTETIKPDSYKKAIAAAVKEARRKKVPVLLINMKDIKLDGEAQNNTRMAAETVIMAGYEFDKYKTKKDEQALLSLECCFEEADIRGLEEGKILAENTLLARDLINEPANIMTPSALAKAAEKQGQENGFEVEVFGQSQIQEMQMGAFLAVAKGSVNEPKLIVMRYSNDPDHPEQINGLVGKGLIFDSGGYSIKPTSGMLEMKSDMSGAASVIGAMSAIAQLKLKINVVAVVAACENMISGNSFRPADIIKTMAGKTVYIGNTDAEGRLTLADAIHYSIEKEKVSNVLDIATLTGAAQVALGDTTTPVISNNDELFAEIEAASKTADERIWRLPIFDDYREKIKAKEADLTNSAGNPGTITAAAFLEAFVQDKPWIHFDIAGTSWADKAYDYYSEGATGCGVRTIYHWLKKKSK